MFQIIGILFHVKIKCKIKMFQVISDNDCRTPLILSYLGFRIIKKIRSSRINPGAVVIRIFTEAFLLFLAPAGQPLTLN